MIYAVIVVMWAAFLVPMWLRRHDEFAEAKSVDKFASKMRVLARRTGEADEAEPRPAQRPGSAAKSISAATSGPSGTVSSTVRIVGRERSPADLPAADRPSGVAALTAGAADTGRRRAIREAWADEADDAALAVLAAPDLARDLARDRGFGRAPASLAARRRRVLAVLLSTALLLLVLGALSVVPWLVAGAVAAVAVAYVFHLRVQAKRTREIAMRRSRAARSQLRVANPVEPGRYRRTATAPQKDALRDVVGDDLDDVDAWQPVSVPVPTYVTAPRAGRPIRRIDLSGGDAWTSGRLVADAAAAGRAAAAAAHQESLAASEADEEPVQRAVGD